MVLHTFSLKRTFGRSLMKSVKRVQQIFSVVKSLALHTVSLRLIIDQSIMEIYHMERTGNAMVNPMTLNCDLDIESAYMSHGFCTSCF